VDSAKAARRMRERLQRGTDQPSAVPQLHCTPPPGCYPAGHLRRAGRGSALEVQRYRGRQVALALLPGSGLVLLDGARAYSERRVRAKWAAARPVGRMEAWTQRLGLA
jgi:hypothetical protein